MAKIPQMNFPLVDVQWHYGGRNAGDNVNNTPAAVTSSVVIIQKEF